jgi:oligosaccharyltransferase complex subunit epsilon
MSTLTGVVGKFLNEYKSNTPKKLKIIDAYLAYILFTGIFQVRI